MEEKKNQAPDTGEARARAKQPEQPEQGERRPFEDWAKELGTKPLHVAVARKLKGFPVGRVVTRGQYEDAIKSGLTFPIR